jgi:hypothetical protein
VRSHSRAGIGLGMGTTIKCPQCTISQRPERCATHNERCRGKRTGHLDQVSATHNERRRGLRPNPRGIIHMHLHYTRPAFALFNACFIRQQAEYHYSGQGSRCPVFVRGARPLSMCSLKSAINTLVKFFFGRLKITHLRHPPLL